METKLTTYDHNVLLPGKNPVAFGHYEKKGGQVNLRLGPWIGHQWKGADRISSVIHLYLQIVTKKIKLED